MSFECIALPDGGRMLTYTDVTDHVHAIEQLRELATVDDLHSFAIEMPAHHGMSLLVDGLPTPRGEAGK